VIERKQQILGGTVIASKAKQSLHFYARMRLLRHPPTVGRLAMTAKSVINHLFVRESIRSCCKN